VAESPVVGPKARSLRDTLTAVGLLAAVLALVGAALVVGLAAVLHRATLAIESSTEGVRLSEEAKIDLIYHAQSTDPAVRADLGSRLQRELTHAESYVTTDREQELLDGARDRVRVYLAADSDPDGELWKAAQIALDELVTLNVVQARAEIARSARVDRLSNLAGAGFGAGTVVLSAVFVLWIRGPLLRPLFDLSRTVEAYGSGELEARASVAGPRELQEIATRFNEMASSLSRQRDERRALIAGVVHDLRNPLSTLRLAVEVVRSDRRAETGESTRRVFQRIEGQITRLERMLSDLLHAARDENLELDLHLERRDVRDILRTALRQLEVTNAERVQLELPTQELWADVDPLRIEQVVHNLIGNAIKYSPAGTDVRVTLGPTDDAVWLTVADHGVGMTEDEIRRAFLPFQRGVATRDIPGVGLGLSVVRRIVSRHGGSIDLDSTPGAGTTVRVRLPREAGGASYQPSSG